MISAPTGWFPAKVDKPVLTEQILLFFPRVTRRGDFLFQVLVFPWLLSYNKAVMEGRQRYIMNAMKIPDDLEDRIASAIQFFWLTRNGQIARQNQGGTHDQGNRGAMTGGKQLDGFVDLIKEILVLNDVPANCIFIDADLELPGYFRPNKKWDLLVVDNNELIIAIEFKSQAGPSFGNNFNNRTEEAMGSALDIWTAYREGVFGSQKAPWLGYFMLLEDCRKSNEPIRVRSPHFPVLHEFADASYKER